ncbi:MAG: tRNA guanosine(34) transglycosylase Tgt [Phycisphaerales bacterium]|nr:tRNA guanosine(34) transglycosylase Tgt [Phycisphaerales bacterium]
MNSSGAGPLRFEIFRTSAGHGGRHGRITTPHGSFDTPAFMPVATAGAMKGLTPAQVRATGTNCILNNAFHLLLRPGHRRIKALGGVHSFMRWDGPILTDSGGFQAFSMAEINRVDEDGVTFRSFIDGAVVHLGPESSMEIQQDLGSDIAMAFDDCPAAAIGPMTTVVHTRLAEAKDRSLRWLERCIRAHTRDDQALFGIVQGGTDLELRRASVEATCNFDLPGYAIGGVAVGEGPDAIERVVRHTAALLPLAKPRYLMGVGYPSDIIMAVESGIDMFDCVLPTRNGRNGFAFTQGGSIRLRNAVHADDESPIEPGCDCEACSAGFSRGYLRHLFLAQEMLGPILVSLHNVRLYQRLLLDIRRAIDEDAWLDLRSRWASATPAHDHINYPSGASDE